MYVRRLHIQNVKLLRDFKLDFVDAQGWPRMWTVILGENGSCKTTILQAIALAATGPARATALADVASLPDKRLPNPTVRIEAEFGFSEKRHMTRIYPGLEDARPGSPPVLQSVLKLRSKRTDFSGLSRYRGDRTGNILLDRLVEQFEAGRNAAAKLIELHLEDEQDPTATASRLPGDQLLGEALIGSAIELFESGDMPLPGGPLDEARSRALHDWFIAGYGADRRLPPPSGAVPAPSNDATLARLEPLFGRRPILGTGFADLFTLHFQDKDLALAYSHVLRQVLIERERLLPRVDSIDLRGRGGGSSASNLIESHRVDYHVGDTSIRLPMAWLSQGYQSMFAWIADVVGQVLLEAGDRVEGAEMEGIVLLDELDLHLHPKWQIAVVHALKKVFPRMQFIATTHSPMVLPYLRQDEVFLLQEDAEGSVIATPAPQSPALLTGSGIYAQFFGLQQIFPNDLGDKLWQYTYLAADSARSAEDDAKASRLRCELIQEGIDPGPAPVARAGSP